MSAPSSLMRSIFSNSVLKLSGCGWAGQEAMTTLFNATSALEDVDLTGCWGCGEVGVTTALVRHNPRLRLLSLANIYGLRNESVEMLARNAKLLESLDVRYSNLHRIFDTPYEVKPPHFFAEPHHFLFFLGCPEGNATDCPTGQSSRWSNTHRC